MNTGMLFSDEELSKLSYVNIKKTEKTKHARSAERFLVAGHYYRTETPAELFASIRGDQFLERIVFQELLYVAYNPILERHVFKGFPYSDDVRYRKVQYYVAVDPRSGLLLKHTTKQLCNGFYRELNKTG